MPATSPKKLCPVSKARPCPVCGGDHKCSTAPSGLVLCGRRSGPVEGFRHLGPAENPTWHKYSPITDRTTWTPIPVSQLRADPPAPPPDFPRDAQFFAARLAPQAKAALAGKLGLPAAALDHFPDLGFDPERSVWVIPEKDGRGEVIGLATRGPDGSKKCRAGSRRGLTLPANWADRPGPVFVVEGFSDTAALAACGVCVVGRPSNASGADHLADLLRPLDPARQVVVFGENDRKEDGSWPGFDGAKLVSSALAKLLPGRTVLTAMPPGDYKDCREWVLDRAAGFGEAEDWAGLGKDIAETMARVAKQAQAAPPADRPGRFKVPIPAPRIAERVNAAGVAPWVWGGFLARGRITLLSALPKCGKTTLIGHLLKALPAGGEFCGRPLAPGAALVVSEESDEVWADRATALSLGEQVRVITQPFFGRPDLAEWMDWLRDLLAHLSGDPADLVVFDTLADLWPAKDENSATDVQAALKPLRKLAEGRAVLLVHHLRKSDGAEGTGSRGSGALAGFVDVIAELRRAKASQGGGANRRVLTAVGRSAGIPPEWVIDLDGDGGFRHVPPGEAATEGRAAAAAGREDGEQGRRCELREALLGLMPLADPGLTRKQLWAALPPELRVNDVRFRSVLEAEAGKLWWKFGNGGRENPFTYRRGPRSYPHPDDKGRMVEVELPPTS